MIITSNQQILELVNLAKQEKLVAIDTEFFWVRTYYPQLCLIQFAVADKFFLIDNISQYLDYSPLAEVFTNTEIEKVMHSAANDIPIINHFLKCEINNLFDTQIAATFLGFQNQISLKALLQELLQIELEKEQQFSDWRKRPLSNKQLNYAINDVKYLLKLRDILYSRLSSIKYLEYFSCEMNNILQTKFTDSSKAYLKLGNIQKHPEKIQKNIIALASWREKTAQLKNIPNRYIFDNKLLTYIAHKNPQDITTLNNDNELKKINPKFKKLIITTLKQVDQFENLTKVKKNPIKLNDEIVDKVVIFFNQNLDNYSIDKSFIASKKTIKSLIYSILHDEKELSNKLLDGWRYRIIGKSLKKYILEIT